MTYTQSFSLCQRRRPVVDPIPAFCDQLKKYEKECREWGYLSAIDDDNKQTVKAASASTSGEKRKTDVGENSDEVTGNKKSKVVIEGPAKEDKKPKSISIGPAAGPTTSQNKNDLHNENAGHKSPEISEKDIFIGPAKPPS